MGSIFNYDGPLWRGLGKLADLIILNLLTILFCVPIVTIGASITATHYTALKLHRGEGYVMRNFWKSFKENFVQSTILWLMLIVMIGICLIDFWYLTSSTSGMVSTIFCAVLGMIIIFVVLTSLWVFPLQSRFINPIRATIKNAFYISIKYLPRTFAMLLIGLVPVVLALLSYQLYIVLFMLGFSGPIYLCAMLYDKKFQQMEELILERQGKKVEMEEGQI